MQGAAAAGGGLSQAEGVHHACATVLAITLAAKLAGAKNPAEMAEFAAEMSQEDLRRAVARTFRGVYRPPAHNTIRRILAGVDAERLEANLSLGQAEPLGLDGKHAQFL